MSLKTQKSPLAATKPRNMDKVMVVITPPLHYLTDDSINASPTDEQVKRLVYIAIKLYRIVFADRPENKTSDVRKLNTAQVSGTEFHQALAEFVSNDYGRPIMLKKNEVLTLNEEQIIIAVFLIPAYYWQQNFWTCREEIHSTFSCPLLSVIQQVYLSHRYYVHQIEANPQIPPTWRIS